MIIKKKILLAIVGVLAILLPVSVFAADFRSDSNNLIIGSSETINNNLYVASGNVQIDGNVNGDLIVFGGQVTINGTIKDDLFIAGGQLFVKGDVGGDVRLAGGNVWLEGKVYGQLLAAGGNLTIEKDATIIGDVNYGGGMLSVSGNTGPISASVDTLSIGSTANIHGNIVYTSKKAAAVSSGAIVSGELTHNLPAVKNNNSAAGKVIGFIVTIIMAVLFLYFLPNKTASLSTDWRQKFWLNLLAGAMVLILTPLAILLLLVSVLGFPIGIGLGLLYPIALYLGNIVAIVALGTWVKNWWEKEKQPVSNWFSIFIGAIAYLILGFIPVLGWLAIFVAMLAGVGALVRYDWQLLRDLKSKKVF